MIITWAIAYFTEGIIYNIANALFFVSGIIWAYEEITNGVNRFRKILGVIVMLMLMVALVQKFN